MTKSDDWDIPPSQQPSPADYAFDLNRTLSGVVSLHSYVPDDAFTANTLGTERGGSGVVIDSAGLIVTIGYLVTEAESVWINTNDGRAIAGHALAVDQETGFGLVQALGQLDLPALPIGDSSDLAVGDSCILAAGGGRRHAIENRLAARQEFAGYWEYALDEAFYTAPAHPFWGGTGLIGQNGELLGIGSLILQQGGRRSGRIDMNMVVPIELLPPILDDLLTCGQVNRRPRPWLGLYAAEDGDAVLVGGLADGGPAAQAGLRNGDRIIAVGDEDIGDLYGLWRRVWACGEAGVEVPMRLLRGNQLFDVTIESGDRTGFLKSPQLH